MGNDISKEIKDIAAALEVDNFACKTPTNNVLRNVNIDPRSPTDGISRTPIEVRKLFGHSEENLCSLRRRWKSEPELSPEKINVTNKSLFHVIKNDPRSPSLGIIRTPIQVQYDTKICEKVRSKESFSNSVMQNASTVVNVSDCRSPSLGILRTPIQVATCCGNVSLQKLPAVEPIAASNDSKITTTPVTSWQTPDSKVPSSPSFVYEDEENTEIQGKSAKQYEQNSFHEKENEINFKKKLRFTPEAVKTGIKVRTPLGSRCNFQDSPSQFLKIMQVQKVDQELNVIENNSDNFGLGTKSVKKTQRIIEWDNKDSTIVL